MRRNLRNLVALADRGRRLVDLATGRPKLRARAPKLLTPRNALDAGRTTVRLYGSIGASWYDDDAVSAADLARTLDTIGAEGIDLHINSGGGDVFDGIAMHALLLDHPSDVDVMVDGIAASAASFIAMAGDNVRMQKPAKMMIHNAAGFAWGNKAVMRELADVLEEIDVTIAQMYADRSGKPVADYTAWMDAETWFSAAAALDAGLIDEVANAKAADPEPDEDEEADPEEESAAEPAPDGEGDDPEEEDALEDRRSIAIRAHHAGLTLAMKG